MVPCVGCRRFFKVKQIGVSFEEGMPTADGWRPYKLWHGDLYECEGCGTQIVTGLGALPLAEHYQPEYPVAVERYEPLVRIDDCPGAFHAEVAAALKKTREVGP